MKNYSSLLSCSNHHYYLGTVTVTPSDKYKGSYTYNYTLCEKCEAAGRVYGFNSMDNYTIDDNITIPDIDVTMKCTVFAPEVFTEKNFRIPQYMSLANRTMGSNVIDLLDKGGFSVIRYSSIDYSIIYTRNNEVAVFYPNFGGKTSKMILISNDENLISDLKTAVSNERKTRLSKAVKAKKIEVPHVDKKGNNLEIGDNIVFVHCGELREATVQKFGNKTITVMFNGGSVCYVEPRKLLKV